MKYQLQRFGCFLICLVLLFGANNLFGQTNKQEHLEEIFPNLPVQLQDDIVILFEQEQNGDPTLPCPPAYTNLLSNRNLFSPAEEKLLKEVALKYKNVTTNSGPAGTVFKRWGMGQAKWTQQLIETFPVAFFVYTNSPNREEIGSILGGEEFAARFRTPSEDGYDVEFSHGMATRFLQYKKGVLDGLYVISNQMGHTNANIDKCYFYLRFVGGKAVGKYIGWEDDGNIGVELEFKKPFDILKYSQVKFDLAWTEVPTNSIPNSK
jgi:hypothetical protein